MTNAPANQFLRFASLWPAASGNGHRGSLERDANVQDIAEKLQAGWGILLFENDQRGNDRAPTHRLVLAPPREQGQQRQAPYGQERQEAGVIRGTYNERRDAPEAHVGQRDGQRAMDMQRPAGRGPTPRGPRVEDLEDSIPF